MELESIAKEQVNAEAHTHSHEIDRQLALANMVLQARQLAVGWADSKSQNIIVVCSILLAVIGIPLLQQPGSLFFPLRILLTISALATLASLVLSLAVTRFRMSFSWWKPELQPSLTTLASIASTSKYFEQAHTKAEMKDLIKAYSGELGMLANQSPLEVYSEAIALNTAVVVSKVRLLNLAVTSLQCAVVILGVALAVYLAGV